MSHEHQLNAGTRIQWFGQAEDTTRKRNHFQFGLPAATVLGPEDGWSHAWEANAGAALNRVWFGDHGPLRVWSVLWKSWRLRKYKLVYQPTETSTETPAFNRRAARVNRGCGASEAKANASVVEMESRS